MIGVFTVSKNEALERFDARDQSSDGIQLEATSVVDRQLAAFH